MPRDTLRDCGACEINKFLAPTGCYMAGNVFDRVNQRRARAKQETGDDDRNDELEQTYAHAACRNEQAAADGFKVWSSHNEELQKVARSKNSAFVDLLANERPTPYRFGRRGERQSPIAQAGNQGFNRLSQAKTEPGHWTQHYEKRQKNDDCCCKSGIPVEFGREPIEYWVERHSNDNAPNHDRQKWCDQDQ